MKRKAEMKMKNRFLSRLLVVVLAVGVVFFGLGEFVGPARAVELTSPGVQRPQLTLAITGQLGTAGMSDPEPGSQVGPAGGPGLVQTSGYIAGTFLIDSGGFSPSGELELIEDKLPMFQILASAKYDLVCLGARDFERGEKLLSEVKVARETISGMPTTIVSNLDTSSLSEEEVSALSEESKQGYVILKKSGIKVAFVNLILDDKVDKYSFVSSEEKLKEITDRIKSDKSADFIAAFVSSADTDKAKKEAFNLAKNNPDVNLVWDGSRGASYDGLTSPEGAEWAKNDVGTMVGGNGIGTKGVAVSYSQNWSAKKYGMYSYEVKDLTRDVTPSSDVLRTIEGLKADLSNIIYSKAKVTADEVVGVLNQPLDIPSKLEIGKAYPLYSLVADSYVGGGGEKSENSISIVSPKAVKSGLPAGDISYGASYGAMNTISGENFRYGNPLVSFYLSADDVLRICQWDLGGENRLFFGGLEYTYNPNRFQDDQVTDGQFLSLPIKEPTGEKENSQGKIETMGSIKDAKGSIKVTTDLMTLCEIAKSKELVSGSLEITPMSKDGMSLEILQDIETSLEKSKDGSTITEKTIKDILVKSENGDGYVASWYALGSYLKKANISAYENVDDRIVKDDNGSLWAKYGHPSGKYVKWYIIIGLGILLAVALVVILIFLTTKGIARRQSRKNSIFSHRKNRYKSRLK